MHEDYRDIESTLLSLSPSQVAAMEAIVGGATHAEAAEAAGVARETVTRWAGHHPAFRAAVNLQRAALGAEQADRLRRLNAKALSVVESALDDGDRAVAMGVLKLTATVKVDHAAAGPTNPGEILDAEVNRLLLTLPPPLPVRDQSGMIDPLAQFCGEEPVERAHRVAVDRLIEATAAEWPV